MKDYCVKIQSALALLVASAALCVAGQPSAPVGLMVNGARNPLAIDRDAARFTWRSADSSRAERQMAYQILVASSPDFRGQKSEVRGQNSNGALTSDLRPLTSVWWDSG